MALPAQACKQGLQTFAWATNQIEGPQPLKNLNTDLL